MNVEVMDWQLFSDELLLLLMFGFEGIFLTNLLVPEVLIWLELNLECSCFV